MSMGCWGDTCPTTSGCGLEEIENDLCSIIVRSCGASTAGTRADRDWGAAPASHDPLHHYC